MPPAVLVRLGAGLRVLDLGRCLSAAALVFSLAAILSAESSPVTADRVLIVVNGHSAESREIGDYYARRRGIPAKHICRIETTPDESIDRATYDREIAAPIAEFLKKNSLVESIYYIVTTLGVPLKISGESGQGGNQAAVDSELALLYSDIKTGKPHTLPGMVPNPFFGKRDAVFSHPEFPIYLVTRLAAYDFEGVKAIIDRSLAAVNRGKFVIDLASSGDGAGDNGLRTAAIMLPKDRVILDETGTVLYNQADVIGYASWGSNDGNRHRRFLGFHWLPGAIMTEYVSTNARTFARPPENWNLSNWESKNLWFAGSPQSLTADYILEGATGASGHVYEPYLAMTPQPEYLLPAYYRGRNLAESYYLSIRGLSWQNIVVGDPLCSIGKPTEPRP